MPDLLGMNSINCPAGFHAEVNDAGEIYIVADSPLPSFANKALSWASERAGESNTHIGMIGGAVASTSIADNAGKAIIAGLSGDYVSCAMYGVPALVGIVGSLAAIITPEKTKGPTDEILKNHINQLSRDELISLLSSSESTGLPATTRPNANAVNATNVTAAA